MAGLSQLHNKDGILRHTLPASLCNKTCSQFRRYPKVTARGMITIWSVMIRPLGFFTHNWQKNVYKNDHILYINLIV